ncbi:hypothetical protein LIER_37750 [Lithospermum erythrorhizon]|uniref:Uncharacterized protein n=1 Tax=Lithospermum erythrorhizon TaxID=34254 RepID=A0AAV3PS09_LITER
MLSGLKFIPRDQVERENHNSDDDVKNESKKLSRKKEKDRSRKKSSRYSSSDDESVDRIKKGSRKKKKWYASDEDFSSRSGSESEHSSDYDKRKKKKQNKKHKDGSEDEQRVRSDKNSRRRRKETSANVSDGSESDDSSGKGKKRHEATQNSSVDNETAKSSGSLTRKEMGLDWMLRPKDTPKEDPMVAVENKLDEAAASEVEKVSNPRELNPYYNDNGSGYPHESEEAKTPGNQLLSSSLVGDGGASWRLKALKRAKEQAAREGRKLDEVVEDRWGSFSHLAVSVATCAAAPNRAHLHAIRDRRKVDGEEERTVSENYNGKGGPLHHARMKVPQVQDSLSWGKRKLKMSSEDTDVVSAAISGINKFKDDGSFLGQFVQQTNDVSSHHADNASVRSENRMESSSTYKEHKVAAKDVSVRKPALTANQLAAKVMQLRMKGKHEEAENLMVGHFF